MKSIKILILNWRDLSHAKAGGAEIVTMEHAKRWVTMGNQVTWLTSWHEGALTEETKDGVRIIRRGGSLTIYLLGFFHVLLHSTDYDVIVDEIHALPFLSVLVSKRPVVVFIHEVAGVIWHTMGGFPLNRLGPFLERLYFPLYKKNYFWTDANSTISELMTFGISPQKCIAIPCPITNPIPSKIPKKNNFPTFLFVSRVVPMKGIEIIIEAFSFIHKQLSDAKLYIVGNGETVYIESLKTRALNYDCVDAVVFKGKVSNDDKLSLMGKAHLLLHASIKEGWGLVVLEAASMGTPSVVYNVPGLKDVVKNGQTGVVLSENSPQNLAKEALALFYDKRRYSEFQQNGRNWAASLNWDDVTKQSLALLQKAIIEYHA